MAGNCYSIKNNRIQQGYYPGFELLKEGTLQLDKKAGNHYLYLKAIDSGIPDSEWGRLHMDIELPDTMVLTIYVTAMNEDSFYRSNVPTRIEEFLCDPEEKHSVKRLFMEKVSALKFINQSDCLLYSLKGRYCYLLMEVSGEGSGRISRIRIEQQGDNFMNTFPEIYRERNSFFHRYLSVFSSLYYDFQDEIDSVQELLDLDTCPVRFLPVYGRWLGIEVSEDFMEEKWLRLLVKEAYQLNRIKGTKRALERVSEIVLGEEVIILEGSRVGEYMDSEDREDMMKLYGDGPNDVTILVKKYVPRELRSKLLFLLNQFKPLRCRLHIIYLKDSGVLNSHSYLDMNAKMASAGEGRLDERQALDDIIHLS